MTKKEKEQVVAELSDAIISIMLASARLRDHAYSARDRMKASDPYSETWEASVQRMRKIDAEAQVLNMASSDIREVIERLEQPKLQGELA